MLILKHNTLPVKDLFIIERHLVRWLDNKGPKITPEWHVLELSRTDLYGHLLGMFAHLKVLDALAIDASQLLDFLVDVDSGYLFTPYHSFYHAADILMMLYYILTELDGLKQLLPMIDIAPLLIAALCHDMGHPGYNNVYQVNSKTPLAQQYKNTSVLENYSVDITQDLLNKHKLFDNVSYDWMDMIKRLIISTDMVYHYELQEKAGALCQVMGNTWSDDDDDNPDDDSDDQENNNDDTDSHDSSSDTESLGEPPTPTIDQIPLGHHHFEPQSITHRSSLSPSQCHDLCRIILHAADISNTIRPWSICKQWSDLIVQEFFQQGDAERVAGLVVSPGMDRGASNQAMISLKFGDFVIKPYFESLARLLPKSRVFLNTLADNRREWMKLKDCPTTTTTCHYPTGLVPLVPVSTPLLGRRVSVPAGLVIIPDHRWRMATNRRRHSRRRVTKPSQQPKHRFTMRSASHPVVIPDSLVLHRSMVNQVSGLIQAQQKVSDVNGSPINLVASMEQN
ncbi:hypothetical protein BC941DRAFT_515934 [Chlamydoabsidia padenii]|nr:hypothetical protein BC941DRAFT_515934 [Chlamydoabsidia padenii]